MRAKAVDGRVAVQLVNLRFQLLLGGRFRQADGNRVHAYLRTAQPFVFYIYLAGGIFPHQDHRKAWRNAARFEIFHPKGQLFRPAVVQPWLFILLAFALEHCFLRTAALHQFARRPPRYPRCIPAGQNAGVRSGPALPLWQ